MEHTSRGIKLPENPSEWGFKGQNYLLTVGIDKYAHWKPLNNAVKDVQDIARILTERYQFQPDHVISLIDADATEDSIRKTLLDVKKAITEEDNLIVYFSGHGQYDPDLDEGYWIPSNARIGHPSDYISNSDLLKWIRAIRTHHTLIIVDSCFSGTLVSQSRSAVLSEKYPSRRIFASGRKEIVDDGPIGSNSPFAKAILSRLSRNTDRVLRASDLIQSVTKVVEAEAGQAPVEGRIKEAGDEGGEFVFHLKVTEEEIWASVVDANTPDEYAKYVDYFPDGKHALEARTKLSELTDATDWNRAAELSTPASLAAYLEAHPRGKYSEEALTKLEELEENEAWQTAKTRDNVSGFMEYLRKYPSGRFAMIARKQLDALKANLQQHEQHLVQDELENIAVIGEQSQDAKTQYKNLVNEAEGFYAQMEYASCVAKYQAALKLYQNHFVPDKKFIDQRIRAATAHLSYLENVEDGKRAVTDGNYVLALEFFRKAKAIDDTAKIREWITHAEQKLRNQYTPVAAGSGSPKKRKSGLRWIFWILGVGLVVVLGVAGYAVVSSINDVNNAVDTYKDSESAYQEPGDNTVPQKDASTPVYQDPPVTAIRTTLHDIVPGTWNVTDRVVGGYSSAATGMLAPASWVFYENGTLTYWENGSAVSGTWSLDESTSPFTSVISIPSLSMTGYFLQINGGTITIVSNELLGQVTNYLQRTN